MKGFRFSLACRVRAADLDYSRRVTQAAVLDFFQEARIGYLSAIGDYEELNIGDGCGFIQREADLKFHEEMFLGDELEVGAQVSEIRKAAFRMNYRIERKEVTMAEGTTLLVAFDYQLRKPRRLPPVFLKALAEFENLVLP